MDNANDNRPVELELELELERDRGSHSPLALALLVSCALWCIAGLAAWRAAWRVFSG